MAAVSKKRIWGWMAFDWASQPFYTLGLTFIFGPYFAATATQYYLGTGMEAEAADAQAQWMWFMGQLIAGLAIAFTAPFLGAFADNSGRKVPWIAFFSLIYIGATWSLWGLMPDGAGLAMSLVIFFVGFFAAESALNFVNAILPSLGNDQEVGRISGSGAAFGYWGGVTSLVIMLALFVEDPATGLTRLGNPPPFGLDGAMLEGTRAVGPFIAIWFALFMVPFFLFVRDDKSITPKRTDIGAVAGDLMQTLRNVVKRRSLFNFLISSMFYRDALNAIYAAGGVYAALVLKWTTPEIGIFGVLAAISAAIFTWAGGRADARFGPMPVIKICIWLLLVVSFFIVGMSRESLFGVALAEGSRLPDYIFYGCGAVIGGAGGAIYAASRSMMVRHTIMERPAESFGLFALSGKATAFLAPGLIAASTAATGSTQLGYLPLIFLFLIGLILLRWVNKDGDREEWSASQQQSQ